MITDAGGGHRGSAVSLKAAIEQRGLPWDVQIINAYTDVWHTMELSRRLLRISGEDIYNLVLKKNLTGTARLLRKFARAMVWLQFRVGRRLARQYFEREKPDLVVSLMPFVNDIYAESLAGMRTPFALLLTDLVDTKPYMWLTRTACGTARFVAVGCDEAGDAALASGVSPDRLVVSGLVIHPKHFDPATRGIGQEEARKRFGLAPDLFTVVVVMGGVGGPVIRRFSLAFESARTPWQVVACVGKNEPLKADLEALKPTLKNRLAVFGFTKELHLLMRAADVVVTKPGPASIFECLTMGTPMVLDDFSTMPQEVPNADFVEREGFGVAVRDRRLMFQAVAALADDPARLQRLRDRIRAFEVKDAATPVIDAMAGAMDA